MKLAIIVGSLRTESYNRKLAEIIETRLPNDLKCEWVNLNDVPFMNEDLENDLPPSVQTAAQQILMSDAVLIVTPEYNRGIPAVTKNIIDWLSRSSTGRPLAGKPVAIGGISSGPIKTAVMQSQLRPVLAHVGAIVLTSPTLMLTVGTDNMTAEGQLGDATARHIDMFIAAMISHTVLHQGAQA